MTTTTKPRCDKTHQKHLGRVGMVVKSSVKSSLDGGFRVVYAFLKDDDKMEDVIRSLLSTATKLSPPVPEPPPPGHN